jgi:two-component system sensor histidine kinase TctE
LSASAPEAGSTLRRKLFAWLLPPLVALFLFDAVGSYFIATGVSDRIYDGELVEIARELVLHVAHPPQGRLAFRLSPEAERLLLLDESDRVWYAVRGADGRLIAGEAALPPPAPAPRGTAFYDAGGGSVIVQVAETLVKRTRLARLIMVSVILPQLALILIAAALIPVGVGRGLAPLVRLRHAVQERSHLDLSPLEQAGVPNEARPLVAAVNDLMQRLDEVLKSQSRFIADAAHQLRTPVAGLKAHIELALREEDLEQMRRALAHIYTSVERLSRLVAQLLSLARNEPSAAQKVELAPLDLGKLAMEATMDWVPEAYKKNIDLGYEGPETPVTVRGDAFRLTELLNNLLDNAIRYTPSGGRVTVRVAHDPQSSLTVSDDGPHIPVEERTRVFERFHRLLGTHADGSGLGLSIVREIATLHHAEITLADDVDGVGNTFSVAFPAA